MDAPEQTPDRVWLRPYTIQSNGHERRLTRDETMEKVEYVRADLYEMARTAAQGRAAFLRKANEHVAALEQENARLREAIENAPCPRDDPQGICEGNPGALPDEEGYMTGCDCWKWCALAGEW